MKFIIALLTMFVCFSASALTFEKDDVHTHTFVWDVAGTGDSKVTAGTIPVFTFPAKIFVKSVHALVETALTGATAAILGDGTATNGFLVDGFAGTAAFYNATGSSKGSYSGEKYYSAADTMDLTLTGTATAGKIKFSVDYVAF